MELVADSDFSDPIAHREDKQRRQRGGTIGAGIGNICGPDFIVGGILLKVWKSYASARTDTPHSKTKLVKNNNRWYSAN